MHSWEAVVSAPVLGIPATPSILHGILHGNICRAQGAAARLKQGAEPLTKRLEQDDSYFSAAAELQKHWKLKVSLRRAIHLPKTVYTEYS